jgi:hypothetical protein
MIDYLSIVYNIIYYSLSTCILIALGFASYQGLRLYQKASSQLSTRSFGLGQALCAVGTAIALLGGLFADSFLLASSVFQQVRFSSYYCGFALTLFGITLILHAIQQYTIPVS